jgi:hypothetical protein
VLLTVPKHFTDLLLVINDLTDAIYTAASFCYSTVRLHRLRSLQQVSPSLGVFFLSLQRVGQWYWVKQNTASGRAVAGYPTCWRRPSNISISLQFEDDHYFRILCASVIWIRVSHFANKTWRTAIGNSIACFLSFFWFEGWSCRCIRLSTFAVWHMAKFHQIIGYKLFREIPKYRFWNTVFLGVGFEICAIRWVLWTCSSNGFVNSNLLPYIVQEQQEVALMLSVLVRHLLKAWMVERSQPETMQVSERKLEYIKKRQLWSIYCRKWFYLIYVVCEWLGNESYVFHER